MVFKFEINGTFRRREDNGLCFSRPRDFVDFCNILENVSEEIMHRKTRPYLSNKLIKERLTKSMTMSVPLNTVDLAERMEAFNGYFGGVRIDGIGKDCLYTPVCSRRRFLISADCPSLSSSTPRWMFKNAEIVFNAPKS